MASFGPALVVVVLTLTPTLPATPPAALPTISPPALPALPALPTPPLAGVPSIAPGTPGGGPPPTGGGPPPSPPTGQGPTIAPPSEGATGGVAGVQGTPRPAANARPGPTAPAGIGLPSYLVLPAGRAGAVLAVALMLLPTLVVIWLLLLVRTFQKTAEWRGSALRLAVAAELGVRPKDLAPMPPQALRALREQLAFDEVTRVLNRPAGLAALEREIARAKRRRLALSVAFVDVDGLKAVNDGHGHSAGDDLLQRVGKVLTSGLRSEDLVFRFGGDEFVCVLPGTSAADALAVMTRIEGEAARQSCGFSFGIGQMQPGDDEVALLGRADERLYEAKRARPEGARAADHKVRLRERLEQGSRRPAPELARHEESGPASRSLS